mmetsp:Transcript_26839/g.43836  ORF Transcript_26839/g.43836 Transcript_26839/m.43836 type:complete len:432 (-) Transcript_26839:209-1504(-)|eukprot:CAMPEP_0184671512 /NCGR_PEP_ID=MMETSP0308-20130426/85549_1 /TAXON_ID=38269 /ORGANISM="Gloeochaete witrockiana, Strain SAG 46.84" /LENGTH=431 /DNA_ID=CAMNT_0027118663 /DNA_START=1165 /DNA_END=2460 /DNA_ORIENTATION=-
MDFSELFRFSGVTKWSPDGRYIGTVVEHRLVIRDIETLTIAQLFTCLDIISDIEWSFDSKYVIASQYKRSCVQVWCIDQPEWHCKIDEGPARIVHARWAPDGRHVITSADFQIRIAIWSLVNQSCTHIKFPKFPASQGLDFTKDGKLMAVAIRRDTKDQVQIYACESWELVKTFPVDTNDLAGIAWSPNSQYLCVWDSPTEYNVLIYLPDGRLMHKYQAYQNAMGARLVEWSPSSQFLAVGSYDQKARLLNEITFKVVTEYSHTEKVDDNSVVMYRESQINPLETTDPALARSRYLLVECPVSVPVVKLDLSKPAQKTGVGILLWSSDGRYLLTKNDSQPNALWIWDNTRLSLSSLLIQNSPIKCASWDPIRPRAAICTGERKIYLWTANGCSCVDVPADKFAVNSLQWNSDGNALVLRDKDRFCCAFLLT